VGRYPVLSEQRESACLPRNRRRMRMITEVGAGLTSITIIMMASEFVATARGIREIVKR
jgi:hypothetical protein